MITKAAVFSLQAAQGLRGLRRLAGRSDQESAGPLKCTHWDDRCGNPFCKCRMIQSRTQPTAITNVNAPAIMACSALSPMPR